MQPQRNWRDLIKPKQLEVGREEPDRRPTASSSASRSNAASASPSATRCGACCCRRCRARRSPAVQIDGVLHEFSTLPGVREDVTDIVLNLKEVRAQAARRPDGRRARIEAKGEGVVTAGDIQAGPSVEILNPELPHRHPVQGGRARRRADDQDRPRLRLRRAQQGRGRAGRHHADRRHLLAHPQGQLHRHQRPRRPAHRLRQADRRGLDGRQRAPRRRGRLRRPHPPGPALHLHQLRGDAGDAGRGASRRRRPSTRTCSARSPSSSSRCARPTACRTPTSSSSASWCRRPRRRC